MDELYTKASGLRVTLLKPGVGDMGYVRDSFCKKMLPSGNYLRILGPVTWGQSYRHLIEGPSRDQRLRGFFLRFSKRCSTEILLYPYLDRLHETRSLDPFLIKRRTLPLQLYRYTGPYHINHIKCPLAGLTNFLMPACI